jgi:hypothetical protein
MATQRRNNLLSATRNIRWPQAFLVAGLVAVTGIVVVIAILAAGPPAAFEAESGTVSGSATKMALAGASGTGVVRFGTAPTPTPTPTPGSPQRFPGDPNPKVSGKAYWGATGTHIPDHEAAAGKSMSIHRTFSGSWSAIGPNGSLLQAVRDDHAKNRLPWISTKATSWAQLASGADDAELDAFLRNLDATGKPVWLTINHEPENDGGNSAEWRAMQSHVRARMTAVGTQHVAFMPVLMSYTWKSQSGRNPTDWYVPGIWDAYGIDHYRDNVSGDMFTEGNWATLVDFAEARGLPVALGEWGNRGTDAQAATEMQAFWDWGFNNNKDILAFCYFDSGLNSPNGSWELNLTPPMQTKFRTILGSDNRVMRLNDLN